MAISKLFLLSPFLFLNFTMGVIVEADMVNSSLLISADKWVDVCEPASHLGLCSFPHGCDVTYAIGWLEGRAVRHQD